MIHNAERHDDQQKWGLGLRLGLGFGQEHNSVTKTHFWILIERYLINIWHVSDIASIRVQFTEYTINCSTSPFTETIVVSYRIRYLSYLSQSSLIRWQRIRISLMIDRQLNGRWCHKVWYDTKHQSIICFDAWIVATIFRLTDDEETRD